ncbi:hypothetical protein N7509_004625 [Penicillium cosmopolitanum]|uniref:Uncharacterized protein n=1 Tax=Penicillium cosmopolitanum TaxID=1131564 RepID=A0A9X0B9C1_9EURO|nr:uncharacterized protein N7509_004625 [Penicillium cosmopolitanum]KAJ5396512.1 hypothetical protein N7509_004625 [Penicillium cosmopolitanum]
MVWFPLNIEDDAVSWSFDIVGLLAVVGGSAIEKHAQAITASPFGSFPRLLPAPETMLDTDRPARLPAVKDVTVVGVHSGNQFTELNFFANVIHDIESLPPFRFQCFRISHRKDANKDLEQDLEKNEAGEKKPKCPEKAIIPLHKFCPLNLVTFASILMTIALFVWAGVQHEAVGLLGLGTMSLSTSMACMSAQWRPSLSVRTVKGKVADGDVVIRTRSGAFVCVKCTEEVARELYAGTEACDYVFNGRYHQVLLATSTVLLMAAIIFFSNTGWKIQIAVGLAYIILNLAYWAMALLTDPSEMWNMDDRYVVEKIDDHPNDNFTQVLWDAIRTTERIAWVKKTKSAPATKNWDGWLAEAKENCRDKDWKCEAARDRWMQMKLEKHDQE